MKSIVAKSFAKFCFIKNGITEEFISEIHEDFLCIGWGIMLKLCYVRNKLQNKVTGSEKEINKHLKNFVLREIF